MKITRRLSKASARQRGYILFELIIALSIFSIGVLGLARTLNASMEVANILNKEQRLRIGLRSFVEEIRRKPMAEMATTVTDPVLEVTYTSTLEPVNLIMTRGGTLSDMYNLKVIASYTVGAEVREETVDVYVYKPAQK
jgi:type II secretory pathway pseudopilin PulG